ncbi:mucin-5AC-like [Tiliqua scincoides]|uniref:mucin-5AC-like n=1 Tax=Tiliqua scincoides TaxID=71010 RepID=UPI003461C7FF
MEFGKGLPVPLWALILTICYIQQKASCTDSVSGRVTIIPPLTTTPVIKSFNPTHNGQVCSAWGNFHIKTFDGEVYRFPGLCNYVFSSHCNTAFEDFNIQIRRMVEGTNVVISSIVMRLVGVDFQMEPETILVNGERVQLPYSGSGFLIEKSSGFVIVSDKMGLTLKWNQKDSVMLELDKKYANQTCGLCGDFNGIPTYNEFFSNNAHITALQFGNMQKLNGPTEDCEDPTPSSLDNCTDQYDVCHHVLTGPEFSQCNHLVGVNDYIEACVQDLCLCDSLQLPSCLCDTFAEYSRQCAHAGGQPQNWRTPDLCPMTCPSNMQYQECGSPCTDTCTNSERSQLCEDHCVDGCFCPSGTVYDDINESGCIPHEQCSCFYNGKSYAPGTTYSDDCLSCSCTGGQWNCTNLPCPGICSVEGGSHISTYDKKTYNVHGDCTYVLSKVCDEDTFTVLGELRKCGLTDTETCLKMVALNINGDQTSIVVRPDGGVFVNWIYTQLPFSAANVTVFRPSTFFTIIQTNSGLQLQIQLVPTMQLFVHLDPSFRGKTCGLCGNFNSRQTDDFKAISGVVEGTASAFANTWKTQAACPNIKQNFEDPCTLSIENEKYAHHWCGLLADTEGPFAKCHASVNPTSYQKNCIFDTCNCERSEDCMCAALSSYVRACADKGIELLGWRANVCTKYTTQCPKSLIYKYNVNTCQPTCRSLNEPDVTCNIKFASVDGCTCDSDTYMDDSGKCVPANKCPCYYKGTLIRSGEVLHDLGVVCTCTQGKLNCIGDGDTKLGKKNFCAAPMVYFDCRNATAGTTGAECQKSCQTLDMHCYSTQCVSGCMCPAGLVSDGKGGCIAMEECPCIHNDATYKPGEKIKVDCNTCVCKDRMWKCSTERCLGTCAVYGDGHIITFDDKRYNFNGKCQYTLVQDYCGQNSSTQGTFRVITENVPCGTTGTTCSKSIKVFLEGYELILSDNHHEVVQRGDGGQIPYRIRYMGIFLVIEITNGLILLWDKKTSIFIKLSPNFKGQVCGLCGNYDDNGINEFTTRSQSIVGDVMEFGNSWKVSPTCPDAKCTKDPCSKNPYRKAWSQKQCSIINSKIFAACHSQVEPTKYYEACVTDACACDTGGDCECFCTAVAAYAQACSEFGVCISWRSPSVCPMFCDYYNAEGECDWHYKPCGAPCMKTCRNPSGRCLYQLPGLEGCYPYCPANKPFFNEDEMKCVDVCGCYEPPDTYYPVGTTFYSRESCKTCQCTSRGKECHYDAEACYCYYEGKSYIYKDVIYNTTDGLGWCIRATCDVNGTIVRELYKCTAVTTAPPFTFTTSTGTEYTTLPETTTCVHRECEWTDWYDVTYPTFGEHNGDYETPENIRAEGYNLCKIPDKVECRAKLYPNEKIDSLNQKIQCTINNGLICNNKDQTPPICYNYEIKFLCCTYTPCGTSTPTVGHSTALPTTHSPSTAPASSAASTQPPVVHTTTQSTTVVSTKPGVTTGKSTATTHPTPLSTVIVTPTGVVSTPPVTQGPTSTSKAPPPQSTTGVLPTTTGCQPKCEWTSWFDVHRPTSSPDDGDRETYQNIRGAGGQFCDNPQDIECRAEDYADVSLSLLGQKLQCNTDVGLICNNADQTGKFKMCYNYQVRFKCCDYKHCQPTTPPPTATTARTSTALPTTHSPSTAPASSAASTQPPVVHTTTQSTTVVSTKPGVTTGKSTATTHPTPLSTVIVTPTGVVSTPPVTQGPTSTSKAPPPQSTTGLLPTTTGCQPKCEWTSWFDVHRPTSSPDDGDMETYQNIRGAGGQFCDNPQDIECRAEDYPDVSLSLLGQKLQCNTDVGLICKNADQTGKFKMCYNYQVRFKCCDYKHCQPTTPPPTATTARTSTALPTTHSPSTAPASSAASTQPPVVHTTTQSTTVVSTKPGVTTGKSTATTHPTPLSTVIVTPTGVVSTPPVTQGPTSTSKAPPPQSTTGVLPTTTGCQPKCEWTSWFDVHRPTSSPDDGDRETYQNIRGAGGQFCDNPQDIECRAEDYPDVSLSLLGQKLQCNTDVGLICNNADQTGKFKMCYNYQVRFKCCDYKHCQPTTPPPTATTARTSTALPTTHSPSTAPASSAASTQPPVVHTTTQSTTVVSTKPGVTTGKSTATTHPTPLSTVIVTPTGVVSTPPVTQGPTSTSKAPPPQSTTGVLPTTTGCQPKCEWTSWFDVHRPTSSPDDGDRETYQNIRGAGGQFCDNPQDIECRAEDYPDVSLSLLGQKLQCNTDVGLICKNADQTGKFKMCYNYQVRFKCCDYKHCQPTTPPPTATTARTSTALPTTHSPSTAPASSAASTQPPVVHTTTQSTTVVSTKPGVTTGKSTATTHPTPLSTVIVTPTGVVSTPPVTQGPTSTSKAPPPQSTTGVLPTTTGCQPKCEWTSWFDVHRPTSSPDDGDRETYQNIRGAGGQFCDNPQDIECRAEDYPDVSLSLLGQKLQCNTDVGLICNNADQTGKFKMCYNYQVRFKCCDYKHCQPTTPPPTATTARTSTALPTTHSPSTAPASSAASTQPTVVHTTTQSTTVVSTKPGVTTGKSTATTHPTPLSTVIVTPTGVVSTPPVTQGPTSTSKAPPPQSTTGVLPTTTGCQPKCEWTSWFDVHRPTSSPDDGDRETYQNIRGAGGQFCDNPQDIECRAEDYPDVSLSLLGQKLQCNTDVGLNCNNADQTGKFKMCYNYQVRFKCCDYKHCQPTTPPPTATTARTSTALPTTHSPSTAPASSAASTQPPVVHTTTQSTTVVSTKPGVTTGKSTATTHPTPLSTVIVTPTGVVSTPPVTQGPTSTSKAPPPQSTTGVLPTTTGCQPKCEWTSWFDVHRPTSSPDDGDRETYQNIRGAGGQFCDNPQDIECRAEDYPDVSLSLLGQKLQCNTDVGLNCNNADQTGKFKMCYNYQVRFKCCDYKHCQPTTPPPTATTARTSTALPTTHSPSTAPASSAASTQPPVVHTTTQSTTVVSTKPGVTTGKSTATTHPTPLSTVIVTPTGVVSTPPVTQGPTSTSKAPPPQSTTGVLPTTTGCQPKCEWTSWFDVHRPTSSPDDGDRETYQNIRGAGGQFCDNPQDIECRAEDYPDVSLSLLGQKLQCNTDVGLICNNADQTGKFKMCYNYQVRFKCCDYKHCQPTTPPPTATTARTSTALPTTHSPSTAPASSAASTQPPVVHTTTQSTTVVSTKPGVTTGKSTATTHPTPLSTVIVTPTGVVSTPPVTQGPTSTSKAPPPQSTTGLLPTTTGCQPKCEWTSWFDVHRPTSSPDDGDRETYQNIRGAGGQFCDNPQDIECRAEDYPDVSLSLLGQKLQCNTDVGLICNNADQTGKFKMCYNYQVRFQCCDYKHCQPTTPPPTATTARTSTALPTTHSPSTAPASSAASTQPPVVHTTTQSTTVVSTKPGVTTGKSTATTHPTPLSTVIVTPTGGVSTPPLTQRPTSTSKVTSLQSTAGTRPTIMISTEGSTTTGKISTTTTSALSPATGPVTETVPPSTPTRSTQPPIVHTTTQSTTKLSTKPEVSTGISTATTHKTPLSTVIITPTGVISTTPVTQGPTSTLTATPPHTTTGSQATSTISTKVTTVCRPKCEWTSWFDVHHPTSSSDDGDRETYQNIRGAGGQFCDNPQDIECRAEDYPDVRWSLLGQKLQCNTDVGLICNNADQTGMFKMCYNYQVRFQCCDYKHCQPTTPPPTTTTARTSTTLPTTHSPSTAPASSAASTQPPIVHTTTQSTTVVSTKPGVTTGKSTATTHPTPLSTVIVTPTGGVSTPPLTQRPTSTSKVTSLQSTAGTRPTIMISTEGSTTTGKISTTTTSALSPATGPVTETVPPSTPTRSTQPPIVHTTTQSTTKLSTKPEVSTGISTATTHKTPLSTVIITPTGVISTTPVTQGPTSTLTATPPHTTTGSQATSTISTKVTTVCRPKCEWTSWFDVHHPTSSSDDGDRETYQNIRGAGGQFCDNPQDIECRAEDYPDVRWSLLGQKLQCNTDVGLICNNADQTGKFKMCYNYQVRFQCCDYKHCQPTTPPPTTTTARTSTTLPTTHSPSTAPASSAASTQPPIVHTTTQSTTLVSTKPGVTTGKSTATTHPTPLSTVIVTPTGGVSTPPLTQRPTSTSKVTSLQSTAGTRPTIMISTEGSTTTGKISTTTTSASSPPTGPVTETVPPSTPTRSTQPPIVHTTTQSTTKLSTKPEVSTGISTATTHKTPLSTVIITPTGVISTTPVTQGPTSTLTATPPHTTTGSQATSTISTKGTTVCRPKCEWTSWFDVHHPTSSSDDGDRETYQSIRGAGGQFCDNPQDIECRAEDYPDVSLSLLGQKLQCNTDVGLICNNADQTGKFKMCYNYQVRFQCCDYKHCQPTTPPPTTTTARTSTTLPTTHSPSTAPASSAASTQPPIVHTTTQSTTVVSTKPGVTTGKSTATTHPTPLSTVIVTPTGGVSTPPLTQRPTSTSKVTSLQSTAGTRPTIMISTEGSTTTGKISTTTTSASSPPTGPVTETVPPSTPTRSTQPPIVHTTTQSTTKLSTKPEVSTGISTATTHKTPLSTVIITPTGVISTTPVTQGPTSTLTATPPHTTTGSQATSTISTKGTTVCRPKCEWTSWFDVHHPTSSSDDGDRETYQNIRGAGGQFCDNPQDIECRAEDYPDVSLSLLGQKLQCNTDVGLICNNADQTGKFKMCYNYQVRFQCCDYKHCQPPTATTARTSTTLPTTHSPSTAPASSAASTQPPIVHTTTQSTTVVSTKPGVTTGKSTATTHPTPLSTVIVTPTGGVSTPPLTQRPTSTSKVTSLQSTAGTRPTIMISTEGSTTTGKISTTTTSALSPATGPVTETVPPSTPTRSTQPPIVHTTTQSTTKLSTKPEVSTGISTATTHKTPLSTVIITPTGVISTTPVTQGPTSTLTATPPHTTTGSQATSTISTKVTTVCRPKCEWTSWFDVHHPTSSSDDGDRETYQNIRGAGGQFCDNPQDIECRAEDYPDVRWSLLGQKLQCNTDVGLICNNADQTGKFKMCYNYQVRFQCCDYKHCQPTTPPPTTTTARTSTTLPTTHSPSTAPASSAASTQPPIVHTTTQSTTVVSTKPGVTTGKSTATTHPTPLSTVIVTPTGGVSTPPLTQRPTSTSKVTSLQSTAGTRPTIMISTEGSTTTGKISTTTTSASSPPSTGPVTETVPPSTPTRSTQPPIVHTTTQSTTKLSTKPEVSTGKSTATTRPTPLSTVIVTPTGGVSTPPVTQGPTSTSKATSLQSTAGTRPTIMISTEGSTTISKFSTTTSSLPSTGPITKSFPPPTSAFTIASSAATTSTEGTTPVTLSTTTPCFCHVSGVNGGLYSPGEVIYNRTDSSGCSFYAVCNKNCEVERFQGCLSTTPSLPPTPSVTTSGTSPVPPTPTPTVLVPSTLLQTTSGVFTQPIKVTTGPVTPPSGCPAAEPPRKVNETWMLDNCTLATCEGNNRITLVLPPPVDNITCASGLQPQKILHEDGCTYHYECKCICSGWDYSKFVTFDGTQYIFDDSCTYILVKEIVNEQGNFSVLIDNGFCGAANNRSCTRSIIINYNSMEIVLNSQMHDGVRTNKVIFNNEVVNGGFTKDGITVTRAGIVMSVEIRALDAFISFDGHTFSIQLPFSLFQHNTEGQCGTCSNDRSDDCRLPSGHDANSCTEMASYWKVYDKNKPYCELTTPTPSVMPSPTPSPTPCSTPSPLCELIKSNIFADCHTVLPPEVFYHNCLSESCQTANDTQTCYQIEMYASLCTAQGFCSDWRGRTQGKCPYHCPEDKVYDACGPIHPATCEDKGQTSSMPEHVAEGCFCPTDKILFNSYTGICVPKSKACPCVGPDGLPKDIGTTWRSNCQECVCDELSVSVQCKPVACPTSEAAICEKEGFEPVSVLTSEDPCCPKIDCRCNISTCSNKSMTCEPGYDLVLNLHEGDCCPTPQCVPSPDVCVVNGTVYRPDMPVPSGPCETCTCGSEKDPATNQYRVECKPITCANCSMGYKRQAKEGDCCGECVPFACVIKLNDTTELLKPGEIWSLDANNCSQYECEEEDGAFILVSLRRTCPIIDPEECNPEEMELTPDGCCKRCKPPTPSKDCNIKKNQTLIRQNECISSELIELTYCEGACPSTSVYSNEAKAMQHKCTCCRELESHRRQVALTCQDGRSINYDYIYVDKCQCLDACIPGTTTLV